MDLHEFDSSILIAVAVLAAVARLTAAAFATLRACLCEYYRFRAWLARIQREYADEDG